MNPTRYERQPGDTFYGHCSECGGNVIEGDLLHLHNGERVQINGWHVITKRGERVVVP